MNSFNLADAYIGAANHFGDRPALVGGDTVLSYRQMLQRSSRTANLLRLEGVEPGQIVAIALSSPIDGVVAAIALWMLDATVVMFDFRSRADERNRLCASFGISTVIENRRPPGKSDYATILMGSDWEERLARQPETTSSLSIAKSPALLALTSGTTGLPQGMLLDHSTFLLRCLVHKSGGANYADCRYLNPLPLHNSTSRNHTLGRLLDGATVFFTPFLSTPDEILERLLSVDANYTMMVPTQIQGLLKISPAGETPLLPKIRTMMCGGAKMPPADNIRAYRELSRGYQVTYASGVIGTIAELKGDDIINRAETVGRPVPLAHVQIVGPDGEQLPIGERGVIRVRSPAISAGLVGDVREKSDRISSGWAYPGDLGMLDESGFLTLTGRASDMIIRGGANVFPEEVEMALRDHPSIEDIAVVGWEQPNIGEEVAAFVVRKGEVSADELIAYSRSRLSPDKRPRFFFFIDRLPRNDMGKVLRRELAKLIPVE